MSPKTATILALLSLTLTLTLPSTFADDKCHDKTVFDVLDWYDLPHGVFPDTAKLKNCEDFGGGLKVNLHLEDNTCKVTKKVIEYTTFDESPTVIEIIVDFHKEISATISEKTLTGIEGVSAKVNTSYGPNGEKLDGKLTDIKVFSQVVTDSLQYFSHDIPSPPLPTAYFEDPLTCDKPKPKPMTHVLYYLGLVAKTNKDVPIWAYKYGRLLPLVVA